MTGQPTGCGTTEMGDLYSPGVETPSCLSRRIGMRVAGRAMCLSGCVDMASGNNLLYVVRGYDVGGRAVIGKSSSL